MLIYHLDDKLIFYLFNFNTKIKPPYKYIVTEVVLEFHDYNSTINLINNHNKILQ